MKYYPAFIDIQNRKAVVVGGGSVAARKVRSLLKAGAKVTVISPELTASLKKLKQEGLIRHLQRIYRKGDAKGAFIVISGTSSAEINAAIAGEAEQLVNVVDLPSRGNFIVPSVVRRGPLTIAVSTEGASPAVSKAIRKEIEKNYGTEFARYLRFVEKVRKLAADTIPDRKKREQFLKSLAAEKRFSALRSKGFDRVSEEILSKLNK